MKDLKLQESNHMLGLTIAGFDPSGGAGILTDVKTMAAHGVHGTAVVTALTAQNPKKVFSVEPIPTKYICEQIDSIFDEYAIKYSKTGLLYSKEIIKAISKKVEEYDLKIVVDPVMVASAGGSLAKDEMANSLKKYLLKNTLLTTPNVSEAEKLSGIKINTKEDAIEAAYKIGKYCNVIITGGHLNGDNIIYTKEDDTINIVHQNLIETDNLHGTGCSFSASVIANLIIENEKYPSEEDNLNLAINKSLDFIYQSVKHGRYGTLNPNFNNQIF